MLITMCITDKYRKIALLFVDNFSACPSLQMSPHNRSYLNCVHNLFRSMPKKVLCRQLSPAGTTPFKILIQRITALSNHTSCTVWGTITQAACSNTCSLITCMDNPSAANTDRNMIHTPAAGIEDQIAWLCVRYFNLLSGPGLFPRGTRKTDTKFLKYRHSKS